MSTAAPVALTCPGCGETIRDRVWVCAELSRRPDLSEALLADRFNRLTCGCGTEVVATRTVVALDLARRLWIACYPRSMEPYWRDLAERTERSFRDVVAVRAPPAVRASAGTWLVRVCFGYSAIREKLVIAGAGLDDAAVETTKLWLLQGRPEWVLARVRLRRVDAQALCWEIERRDGTRELARSPLAALSDTAPPDILPGALGADAFVDARRFFVAPRPAPPELFGLIGASPPTPEDYLSLADPPASG